MNFDDPDSLRLAAFLLVLLVMFGLEGWLAARRWQDSRARRLGFHAGLMLFNTVILRFTVATPLLLLAGWAHNAGWGLAPLLGLHGAVEIIATIVVFDMFDYWWHRWNHRVPLLWRFHKVHHEDTHVDVTTALRFHPGELFISAFVWATWVLIWGPSLWGLAAAQASISLASLFHHSNIDFPDWLERPLRTLIVTPRYHAAHHTVSRRTGDANFATVLSCWDRLWGSFGVPDHEEMQRLGLPEGRDSYLSFFTALRGPMQSRNMNAAESPTQASIAKAEKALADKPR